MAYPPVGQIGESLAFVHAHPRVSPDRNTIFRLHDLRPHGAAVEFRRSAAQAGDHERGQRGDGTSRSGRAAGLSTSTEAAWRRVPQRPRAIRCRAAWASVRHGKQYYAFALFRFASQLIAQLPFSVTGSATNGGAGRPAASAIRSRCHAEHRPGDLHTGSNGTQNNLPAVYPGRQRRALSFTNPIHRIRALPSIDGTRRNDAAAGAGDGRAVQPAAVVKRLSTIALGSQTDGDLGDTGCRGSRAFTR